MTITHTAVVVIEDDGTSPVGTDEWNAAHTITDDISPGADDGAALGVSGTAWADLFLASGGVINWAAGNVTVTHATGALTVAGGPVAVAVVAGGAAASSTLTLESTTGTGTTDAIIFKTGTQAEKLRIDTRGFVGLTGCLGRSVAVKTDDFTVAITENNLIVNKESATASATLPTASDWNGRELYIKTIAAQSVISAAVNVIPLAGGATANTIVAGTAGKYAKLVSDGTSWHIMEAN